MSLRSSAGSDLYATGERHLLIALHEEWLSPGSLPACILSTGYTASPHQVVGIGSWEGQVIQKITEQYSVFSIDSGGVSTFGNDTAITAIDAAVSWQTAQGRTGPYLLVGTSMGFCDLMAWARTNQELVAGAIGLAPLVDLTDIWQFNRGSATASVNTAYGGTYVPGTHGPTHNPVEYADELAFPIMVFYATDDTSVPLATVTAFDAVAPDCTIVSVGALGHTAAAANAAAQTTELTTFIDSLI